MSCGYRGNTAGSDTIPTLDSEFTDRNTAEKTWLGKKQEGKKKQKKKKEKESRFCKRHKPKTN